MKDLLGLMGKAKEMQAKFQAMQDEIANLDATGQAGGGLVQVTLSRQVRDEIVEGRPVALQGGRGRNSRGPACWLRTTTPRQRSRRSMQEKTKALTAGLPIPPGMKLPF